MHARYLALVLLLTLPHRTTCRYVASLHERRLRAIVSGLMREGALPDGSIIDAGANDGEEACRYAAEQPFRIVHALDPLAANINATLRRWYASPFHPANRPQLIRPGPTRGTVAASPTSMPPLWASATHRPWSRCPNASEE